MKVILIRGFNTTNSDNTVGRLRPYLETRGFEVVEYKYPYRFLLGALWKAGKDAEGLCAICNPGDIVIAHSHACKLTALAIEMGAPIEQAIFIRPALDRDWVPPSNHSIKKITVYYSPDDRAVWLAQFSPWKWGGMGHYGPVLGHPKIDRYIERGRHSVGFIDYPGKYLEPLNYG